MAFLWSLKLEGPLGISQSVSSGFLKVEAL